ncbi:hypothetical protein D3C80_2059110 [compost metagenome]
MYSQCGIRPQVGLPPVAAVFQQIDIEFLQQDADHPFGAHFFLNLFLRTPVPGGQIQHSLSHLLRLLDSS